MELKDCLDKINKNRERVEAPFVMCLWRDPTLYDDYKKLNENDDNSIITEDSKFYFELGKAMYNNGYRTFDSMTVSTFLSDKPAVRDRFEEYGGYREVETLKALCDPENIAAYYEEVARLNVLSRICTTYFKQFENIEKFKNMSSQNIYDLFEYQLNNSSLSVEQNIKIETLTIDDNFIEECNAGETVGIDYSEHCPGLCAKTLGLPKGDLVMVAAHSGVGKSSFLFDNIILAAAKNGVGTCVISNEMQIKAYKHLLLVHILTQDLGYWDLTRKKLKQGNFTDEQMELIKKAQHIQKEKYSNIHFVKMFNSSMDTVVKIVKKLSKRNIEVFCYDTLKVSDDVATDGNMWQNLLMDNRKLFQAASMCDVCVVTSVQLAIHTENIRYLTKNCLSNGKQIIETYSEAILLRKLWDDERDKSSKFYCKPYKLKKSDQGGYTRVDIELDPKNKYIVAFLDKTRNDEDGLQFLYEWNARFNKWVEVGQCFITNSHERF